MLSREFISEVFSALASLAYDYPIPFSRLILGSDGTGEGIKIKGMKKGIAAIGGNKTIYLNEKMFVEKEEEKDGVKRVYYNLDWLKIALGHELLHVVFESAVRGRLLDPEIETDKRKHMLWNMVTDAFINHALIEMYGETAQEFIEKYGGVTFEDIKKMLEDAGYKKDISGLLPEEIYRLLAEHVKNVPQLPKFDLWHDDETDDIREEVQEEGQNTKRKSKEIEGQEGQGEKQERQRGQKEKKEGKEGQEQEGQDGGKKEEKDKNKQEKGNKKEGKDKEGKGESKNQDKEKEQGNEECQGQCQGQGQEQESEKDKNKQEKGKSDNKGEEGNKEQQGQEQGQGKGKGQEGERNKNEQGKGKDGEGEEKNEKQREQGQGKGQGKEGERDKNKQEQGKDGESKEGNEEQQGQEQGQGKGQGKEGERDKNKQGKGKDGEGEEDKEGNEEQEGNEEEDKNRNTEKTKGREKGKSKGESSETDADEKQEDSFAIDEEEAKELMKELGELLRELKNEKIRSWGVGSGNWDVLLGELKGKERLKNIDDVFMKAVMKLTYQETNYKEFDREIMKRLINEWSQGRAVVIKFAKKFAMRPFIIIIILDTSGSMVGSQEIEELLAAMKKSLDFYANAIRAITRGSEPKIGIVFMEADEEVKEERIFRNFEQFADFLRGCVKGKNTLKGGGGTDFAPALTKIAEKNHPIHMVVYLTDGYAETSRLQPIIDQIKAKHGVPVVFAISREGTTRYLAELNNVILTQLGKQQPTQALSTGQRRRFKVG